MFRFLLPSTPTSRRTGTLLRSPSSAFSSVSASSKETPFVFNSPNPVQFTIPFPLSNFVEHCKTSQSHVVASTFDIPDVFEQLVARYQGSSCSTEARELHLRMCKNGFSDDLFLCNTLINVYVKCAELDCAIKVFGEMCSRNSVTWACLISGYTLNGAPEEACSLFRDMIREGFVPNHYVFGSVLRACQKSGQHGIKLGKQVQGLTYKTPYAGDKVSNVLISMYGSLDSTDDAIRVFSEINWKNSVSWNSIISAYSQRGDAESAFEMFSLMQKDGDCGGHSLKPNEYTFGSLLTATSSLGVSGLNLLEQMLTRVTKSGFLSDLYVGSALVSVLARLGLTDHAKEIFWGMTMRNAVSVNGLMVGLVRQKQGEEATDFFIENKTLVDKNVDSYIVLLSAIAEFGVPESGRRKGREVHARMIRTGLIITKVVVGNALVNMYAKCGAVADASSVFSLMVDRDLVSWNSLISGFDQNEWFVDSATSYCEMRRNGLMPSNFTLISTLSSCARLCWIVLGQQIHGEGIKLGLDSDVSVSNALLTLYAESGYLSQCHKVFNFMQEHDQVSWNSMIGLLSAAELKGSEAVSFFKNMMRGGWDPNAVTFMNIFTAASSMCRLELVHQLHSLVFKHHIEGNTAIDNALISCYGKCGKMDECEKIFSRISDRRDEVSWNAMISGYIHNEQLIKAMDLVWFMLQKGQRLDSFTFATVLSACASVATLERGMEVHACGTRAYLESDVVVGSALVDMYTKCGRIDYASRFFGHMPVKNVYSWNSMISGYARHGQGKKALNLFTQMKLKGHDPDHVTFVGVLSACSHVGLVDEGFKHFNSMTEKHNLVPKMEHYSCMVDLLGRAGKIGKIEDFVKNMPMEPNILLWRTVLGACCRANGKNTELGQKAANMLFELEPQNAVNYVLLSNMYASGEKWEEMENARKAMRKANVKKEAGCSWVTMKDGVHVFVAGDKSHPDRDLIYQKLKELNAKMKDLGYVPQTKFALYDLDQESKEQLLSYHSEKIAVAFVLTREWEMPIRIMKNLRVCGDCHVAFKYISTIVRRRIVLRDSNRFHHFEDGECSCQDYW